MSPRSIKGVVSGLEVDAEGIPDATCQAIVDALESTGRLLFRSISADDDGLSMSVLPGEFSVELGGETFAVWTLDGYMKIEKTDPP